MSRQRVALVVISLDASDLGSHPVQCAKIGFDVTLLRILRTLLVMASFLIVGIACVSSNSNEGAEPAWEESAISFFDSLSAAYQANDFYGVLDFYGSDAFQERWRGAVRGGLLIRDLLVWNTGDLGHELVDVHLGENGALILIRWERPGGLSVIQSTISEGVITAETVFDHGAWLDAGLRLSTDIVAVYEDLYLGLAQNRPPVTSDGIAPDVTLVSMDTKNLMQTINTIDVDGPAVFLGPADFGVDPGRAVGIYLVTDENDCQWQVALLWEVVQGEIVSETRYDEPRSFADCRAERPAGWWTDLQLPKPRDEVVSGVVETTGGHELRVHNGTPRLEQLILTGFDRFSIAGLDEPRFDGVTFEPTRRCEQRSGRLMQDAETRELFLCLFETDLCANGEVCEIPSVIVRTSVLHELAHAWIIDNLDVAAQERLLEASGLQVWQDTSVPWPERGVEYAAEVIVWGLMEENLPMVRIGRPSCDELRSSFEILTGVAPLREPCGQD